MVFNLLYSDFAYSVTMQAILLLYNILFVTFYTYLTTNIIMEIYQQRTSFKVKLLYSFLTGTLTHIIFVYGTIYGNLLLKVNVVYHGFLYNIITVANPIHAMLFYFLGVKVLRLSRFSSIKIMRLSYMYFIICRLIVRMVSLSLPSSRDVRGFNYLFDCTKLLIAALLLFILYKIVVYIVRRTYISVHFPDNLVVHDIRIELMRSFIYALVIYVFVVTLFSYEHLDWFHCLLLAVALIMCMAISIFLDYTSIQKGTLANKDVHTASLTKASDGANAFKRDFSNILQTYSGYLYIQNYKELERYHQSMVNMTKLEGDRVDLLARVHENPAFYALLLNKLDLAEKRGIPVQLNLLVHPEGKQMDNSDFCKVLEILLNNAIEAAEHAESKKVSLSIESKSDNAKLVILSNSTDDEVDIKEIMLEGYSTKSGHTGQGLSRARSILSKYGHCTLNANYYDYEFTVYLEIRDKAPSVVTKTYLHLVKG